MKKGPAMEMTDEQRSRFRREAILLYGKQVAEICCAAVNKFMADNPTLDRGEMHVAVRNALTDVVHQAHETDPLMPPKLSRL